MRTAFLTAVIATSLPLTAFAQSAPKTTTQIPAGSTAALGSVKSPGPAPTTPQGKMLDDALSKKTRATLQDAMNSGAK